MLFIQEKRLIDIENEVLGMYELQLVNNGCLAEYSEDYKVFVESILLDSEALKNYMINIVISIFFFSMKKELLVYHGI